MIDVIIPAYNCTATIRRTLGSLVSQTCQDFTVTVVDDCSTEDIQSAIAPYRALLTINYIRNDQNVGPGLTRQAGLDHTNGEHIIFVDADDVLLPWTVENYCIVIESNPNTTGVRAPFYEQTIDSNGDKCLLMRTTGGSWCHSRLYSRDIIDKFGIRFSPKHRWCEDTYFNAIYDELAGTEYYEFPMYLWCNNAASLMRSANPDRDAYGTIRLLRAIYDAATFVIDKKGSCGFINSTLQYELKLQESRGHELSEDELDLIAKLTKLSEGGDPCES